MWLVKHVARGSRTSDWRGYALIACIALLALMLAGTSWSARQSSVERIDAEQRQGHTLQVLLHSERLRTGALQMMRGERGYLLTDDTGFLVPYHEGKAQAFQALGQLAALTEGTRAQRVKVAQLEGHLAKLDALLATMIDQQETGRHDEAVFYVRKGLGRGAIDLILQDLDSLESTERQLLAERTEAAQQRALANERYQYVLALVGLALLVLAVASALFVRRAVAAEATVRRELENLAATDPLTGLPNRRSFFEALERSVQRIARDDGSDLCLAIFDIDHFKQVNDRFGHPAGDAVICEAANRAVSALRSRDIVARIGGEEFAVILPAAALPAAQNLCERLREAVALSPVTAGNQIIPFTVSVGVAQLRAGDDADRLLARADAALYNAKNEGRDRVCLAA